MDDNSKFDFVLDKPIRVAKGGESVEVNTITFNEPTAKVRNQAASLSQLFNRAVLDVQKKLKDEVADNEVDASGDEKPKGEQVVGMLMMGEESIERSMITFVDLVCSDGTAFVDGSVKMTKPIFDTLSYKDAERALGEYLAHFLV